MMEEHDPSNEERLHARLRRRTAIGGAIIFLIPFLLFTLLLRMTSESYVRRQTLDRLQGGVATNARLLDDVLALRLREAESVARILEAEKLSAGAAQLQQFVANHPWYEAAGVADHRQKTVLAVPPGSDFSAAAACAPSPEPGSAVLFANCLSPLTGQHELFIAVGMRRRPAHKLLLQLSRERMSHRFLNMGIGETEQAFLVNEKCEVVSQPAGAGIPQQGSIVAAGQANPFQGASGTAEYRTSAQREVLAAFHQILNGKFYLVMQVDRAELQGPVQQLRSEVMLYVLPFLLLGVVLAVLAWQFAMRHIQGLLKKLYVALQTAQQRERERDVANRELAERFEKERELARQQSQFQSQLAEYEKYAALAQLALGAAHEINNPLLGILSHLELELRATSDPQRREEIEQCIEGARRIAATLRGLINYARPGPLSVTRVRLRQMLEDALVFLAHQPLFRNITLQNDVPPDLPAFQADANQLSQVLMNLLLNAAQAMPHGGRITIAAQPAAGEKIEVRVEDTGTGIPPDVLPHIFEPFFTTKRGKGTGLGLSITQAYVRNHGGEIEVRSAPGSGTVVRFTMPLEQTVREEQDALEVTG
jgi:signal transduction histidine kinase